MQYSWGTGTSSGLFSKTVTDNNTVKEKKQKQTAQYIKAHFLCKTHEQTLITYFL